MKCHLYVVAFTVLAFQGAEGSKYYCHRDDDGSSVYLPEHAISHHLSLYLLLPQRSTLS
jgi:hypothetical protein